MSFIDTDDPFSIAAKRIRSSVIRSTPEPQLPIQGKQQPTTYIIEPDLMESQTGKMNLPNDVAFDDAGFAYNTVTGNPVQIIRRPNVLPVARTPDGFTFAMPKMLDIVGNVISPLAAGRVPVKAGEVVLGSGAVRTMPETVKEITPFYSALERTVDNAKIGKADANQWLGYLKNQPGVKSEELAYVLKDLPQGPITKNQLQNIVQQNKVQLNEVVKGKGIKGEPLTPDDAGYDPYRIQTNAQTKYHNYQLPGGENYQEMLLTTPVKLSPKTKEGLELTKRMNEGEFNSLNDSERKVLFKKRDDLLREGKIEEGEHYKSSHWDEPNILAHVRYNDRNIPDVGKSLHLEEIQSDWHQAGRKQGYKQDLEAKAKDFENKSKELISKIDNPSTPNEEAARLMGEHTALIKEWQAHETALNRAVPDAPFKKNWDELAFKRMLHKAANEGYDSISWTPGEAQAARYDLSKQISKLQYFPGRQRVQAFDKNGNSVIDKEGIKPDQLPDIVGKEVANKLLSDEFAIKKNFGDGGVLVHEMRNADLKIGGEGMKSFYDKMLVDKANALAKKYGAKVETRNLQVAKQNSLLQKLKENGYDENADIQQILADNGGRKPSWLTNEELDLIEQGEHLEFKGINQQPVHVLKLTPELRAKAKEGFPLFSSTPITTPVDFDPFNQNKKYKLIPIEGNPFQ